MTTSFTYYRVSTDEQAQQGKSIEAQGRMCRKWAKDNDYRILEEFKDEGKSATNLNRPALQEMLSKCTSGINAVIVQDTDRLARNTLDHLTVRSLLDKNNVELISISQPMIDNSPEGNLVDTIIASVNAFQSQITGRKTSKVLNEKAKIGWYPAPAPLGYANIPNKNPTSSLDKNIIDLDPITSPHIKKCFEIYALGDSSIEELTKYLQNKGVPSAFGNKIGTSVVHKMLRNIFYTGDFIWAGTHRKGKHPKLVSKPLFEKVQRQLDKQNNYAVRKRRHKFLLRGILFCSECGSRYWAERHQKRDGYIYDHYYCSQCKPAKYFKVENIDAKIESVFKDIQLSPEYVTEVLATAKRILKESRSNQDEDRKRLLRSKSQVEKAIREAEDSRFVHRSITEDQFAKIYERYTQQIEEVEQQLANLTKDHSSSIKVLEQVLRLAENIGNAYKKADFELKRNYLNLFFDKIDIDLEGNIRELHLKKSLKPLIEADTVRVSNNWLRG